MRPASRRWTVADLLTARGRRSFAMLRVETLEEAEAAERAALQEKRVAAMGAFAEDVRTCTPPSDRHVANAADEVAARFREWLAER